MNPLPTYFISHGAPDIGLRDTPAARFLQAWGTSLPDAKAILVVSAHWETAEPMVTAHTHPPTIHDFGGFPAPLYDLRYPAPGSFQLATETANRLVTVFPMTSLDTQRGLDHGAWMPLLLALPDARIPVIQLSIQPHRDARHHFEVGKRLKDLREQGVVIVGSGNVTHNLRAAISGHYREPPQQVLQFSEWLQKAVVARDDAELLDWVSRAPDAIWNHPTPDHLLPLFVVMGASADSKAARQLHTSIDYGVLSMDAYEL
jgi:4,5-DOPA dioxygenase extradiol